MQRYTINLNIPQFHLKKIAFYPFIIKFQLSFIHIRQPYTSFRPFSVTLPWHSIPRFRRCGPISWRIGLGSPQDFVVSPGSHDCVTWVTRLCHPGHTITPPRSHDNGMLIKEFGSVSEGLLHTGLATGRWNLWDMHRTFLLLSGEKECNLSYSL